MSELGVHEKRIPNGRRREERVGSYMWWRGREIHDRLEKELKGTETKERKVGTTC